MAKEAFLSLAGIDLFCFLFLIVSWAKINKNTTGKNDFGLLFIAFGVLMWFFIAMEGFYFYTPLEPSSKKIDIFGATCSAINNSCFLASIVYFKHGFDRCKDSFLMRTSEMWITTSFLISSLMTIFTVFDNSGITDCILSVVITMILGYAILYNFKFRKYNYFVLLLATFVLLSHIWVQILGVASFKEFYVFFSAYKIPFAITTASSFIGILLLLANSWATEEIELRNDKDIEDLMSRIYQKDAEVELLKKEGILIVSTADSENPMPVLHLRFYYEGKGNSRKYAMEITDSNKRLIVNSPPKSTPSIPYINLLIYALAKKLNLIVMQKEKDIEGFGLLPNVNGDIYKSNYRIIDFLSKASNSKFTYPLFTVCKVKGYELSIDSENISIEIWQDILNDMSEVGCFLFEKAAGFTQKQLKEIAPN